MGQAEISLPVAARTELAYSSTSDRSRPLISSHRRRPVPMAELGPGLRREDKEGGPDAFGRMAPVASVRFVSLGAKRHD
jgi:hypothetical protein